MESNQSCGVIPLSEAQPGPTSNHCARPWVAAILRPMARPLPQSFSYRNLASDAEVPLRVEQLHRTKLGSVAANTNSQDLGACERRDLYK